MSELKNDEEEQQQQRGQALPAKRKPDLTSIGENKDEIGIENGAGNENGDSKKKQKSEISADDTIFPYVAEEKEIDDEDEYITDDDSSDDEDDEDEDDEDSDEHSNGKAKVVDRKGKGILRDDKGKGKMIEESDDTSDGLDDSDGDSSDLSDDPLAEVDLDNILPSRTRGRVHRPGVLMSDDLGNKVKDDNDDSHA